MRGWIRVTTSNVIKYICISFDGPFPRPVPSLTEVLHTSQLQDENSERIACVLYTGRFVCVRVFVCVSAFRYSLSVLCAPVIHTHTRSSEWKCVFICIHVLQQQFFWVFVSVRWIVEERMGLTECVPVCATGTKPSQTRRQGCCCLGKSVT